MTYVEVARVQVRRVLVIRIVKVAESDIVNVAVAYILTGPGLESAAKLAVDDPYVFDEDVLDVVQLARVLTDGTHGFAVRAYEVTMLVSI